MAGVGQAERALLQWVLAVLSCDASGPAGSPSAIPASSVPIAEPGVDASVVGRAPYEPSYEASPTPTAGSRVYVPTCIVSPVVACASGGAVSAGPAGSSQLGVSALEEPLPADVQDAVDLIASLTVEEIAHFQPRSALELSGRHTGVAMAVCLLFDQEPLWSVASQLITSTSFKASVAMRSPRDVQVSDDAPVDVLYWAMFERGCVL